MKILVTGGAGFIGSNFIHYMFNKYDDEVEIINLDKLTYAGNLDNLKSVQDRDNYEFVKGDICDPLIVNKLVKQCDFVINFAAETHVDRSINDPLPFIKTDVYGTGILLNAVKENNNVKKFVQISTDEVYGEALHPDGSKITDPLMPKSPYAASKAGADRLAYSYYTTYDLPVVISRCSNNYGSYQYPEKLIPLFITNLIDGNKMPVYGSGENTRDWIHVLDHCAAIDKILNKEGVSGKVFNIGGGVEKSVNEISSIILKYFDESDDMVEHVTDRLGHVQRHAVDTSKTKEVLNWDTKHDFEEGIKETIDWFVSNEWWWRKLK
jgi:dTDP-glucose 4,6-dehydratase